MFGCTSKNLEEFLRGSLRNLQLNYEKNKRDCIIHALATDGPNKLQQYILLGASYVQIMVHALNDHFLDFPEFNVAKPFNCQNYSSNDSDQITNTKLWLKRILLKFQYTKEKSDMCKGEILEFTETLQHKCENKSIFEAWCICDSNLEWHTNWLKLIQLWQKVIFIPSSKAICDRGFSKQNAIKNHLCNRLNLKTLDALMRGSLCGLEVQWIGLPSSTLGETCETKGYLCLIDSFFVTNQDYILII